MISGCVGPHDDGYSPGQFHAELRQRLPELNVLGGCCGTDDRHVGRACAAWLAPTG